MYEGGDAKLRPDFPWPNPALSITTTLYFYDMYKKTKKYAHTYYPPRK